MLRTLFLLTILAGALTDSALAYAPDAGCALPSEPKDIPAAVHQLKINKREGGEGTRLWVDSLDGLLGLVEIGAVELHPWNATVRDFEHADSIVIDLDPGEGVEWQAVVEAALRTRELMQAEGLKPWPKLTGGKGIHLVAPLDEPVTHDQARAADAVVTDAVRADCGRDRLALRARSRGRRSRRCARP